MTYLYVAIQGNLQTGLQAYGPYHSHDDAAEKHPHAVILRTSEHHDMIKRKPSLAQRIAGERGTIVITGSFTNGYVLRGMYRSEAHAKALADTYAQSMTMTLHAPPYHAPAPRKPWSNHRVPQRE